MKPAEPATPSEPNGLEGYTNAQISTELRRRRRGRECARKRVERKAKRARLEAVRFRPWAIGVLEALADAPGKGLTVTQLADWLGPSPQCTRNQLRRLMDKGAVFTHATYPAVWSVTRYGREVLAEGLKAKPNTPPRAAK